MAKSSEVAVATSLLGGILTVRFFGGLAADTILDHTRMILAGAGGGVDSEVLQRWFLRMVMVGVLPFLGIGMVMAVASGVVQVGFTFAPKAARPKLANLSIRRGLQRFKPSVAGWELARTVLKLSLLVSVLWTPLSTVRERLLGAGGLEQGLGETASLIWLLLTRAAAVGIVIAVSDYTVTRVRTNRQLRMSKQEVRQEFKETEGDPMVAAQRRRRQLSLSRNRMILEVGSADVVVTNPVHLALAIRYLPPEAAPRVVAKGAERMAERIRKEARRHGVPVIENKPLARSLYRRCRVGQFVPTVLYEAVAVVLATAYRRRGKRL